MLKLTSAELDKARETIKQDYDGVALQVGTIRAVPIWRERKIQLESQTVPDKDDMLRILHFVWRGPSLGWETHGSYTIV